MTEKNIFCPVPWDSLYHQVGITTSCHRIRNVPEKTVTEYLNGETLHNMKKDFVNNTFPSLCNSCEKLEKLGIKSTREQVLTFHGNKKYKIEENVKLRRLELRFSNLCNFKCRMCEPYSSSEIAKELIKYDKFSLSESIIKSDNSDITELKKIAETANVICLTGGEPFLIKEYYDFLDHLIEKDVAKNIVLQLYTNCSTYSEKFISRLLKFKSVLFIVSIDGVEKVAEYIRHGTDWKIVKANVLKFAKMDFKFAINIAISQYTLLDISNLAKFITELYNINNLIVIRYYTVIHPEDLNILNMPINHRSIAIKEIDKAIEILKQNNFILFVKEIKRLRDLLETTKPINPEAYIKFTETLDKRRNEKFEDVFGFSLR